MKSWLRAVRLAMWGWLATIAACLALAPLVADSDFLVSGAVGGAAVAVVGAAGRLLHVPVPLVLVLQLFSLLEWVTFAYAAPQAWGMVIPTRESMTALVDLVQAALATSQEYAPPSPADRAVDAALAMVVGAVALLVDLVAAAWRRPALAGLVFLGVYMAPVSLLAGEVPVLAFVPGALAYVFLIGAEQRDRVSHWGRQISVTGSLLSVRDRAVAVSTLVQSGRRVGLGAVALAVVVPIVVPTFPRTFLADGPLTGAEEGLGGTGDATVEVDNPILDLRRNLGVQSEQVLVTVLSDGPAPSYLRIAALDEFTGSSWEPGPREDDSSTPVDRVEGPPGLLSSVARQRVALDVRISELFRTSWLPTLYPVTTMNARGSWGVDVDNLDVSARAEGETGAGLDYLSISTLVLPTAAELANTAEPDEDEVGAYLELPAEMPTVIGDLADQVTVGAESDFEQAVALQDWFRRDGGFRYSVASAPGDGLDTIQQFLQSDRVGYCEQFAASMALMARELGIPSRVAVGFLQPEAAPGGSWVFRGVDMHAWPELYFESIGWVRFEPTPAVRTGAAPSFDDQSGENPTSAPTATAQPTRSLRPDTVATPAPGSDGTAGGSGGIGAGQLVALVGLPLLGLGLLAPRATRAVVRTRRWRRAGLGTGPPAAEVGWRELTDLAVDLGIRVDPTATLRTSGRALRPLVDDDPAVVDALNRLVIDVERSRFAPSTAGLSRPLGAVRDDVEQVHQRLAAGRSGGQRWRATWLPASVLPRPRIGASGPLRARLSDRGAELLMRADDQPRG